MYKALDRFEIWVSEDTSSFPPFDHATLYSRYIRPENFIPTVIVSPPPPWGRVHGIAISLSAFLFLSVCLTLCLSVRMPMPALHYSVDLRIQTYTEPVPLTSGKLAIEYPRIYGYFYSVA